MAYGDGTFTNPNNQKGYNPNKPFDPGILGFRRPTPGLNLMQIIKPIPGTKEHYKQMQMLQNAYKPSSLATFLFGFE